MWPVCGSQIGNVGLKISGLPYHSQASSSASVQKLATSVFDSRHASGCHLSWKIEVGMDTTQRFKVRIERLLAKGGAVLNTHSPNSPGVIGFPTLDHGAFTEWRAQSLSLLGNLLGAEHVYVTGFEREVDRGYTSSVKAGI